MRAVFLITAVMLFFVSGLQAWAREEPLKLTSLVFADQGMIPERYTCHGADVNPPLSIRNVPEGARSLVLTMHDPQGLAGPWVHWVVFDIAPETTEIREGDDQGVQALNDQGEYYYFGPCPEDSEVHEYIFDLYAVNVPMGQELSEGETMSSLLKAVKGNIMAQARLVGKYRSSGE